MELSIRPARVLQWLTGCIGMLFLANAIVLVAAYHEHRHLLGFARQFDLNTEANVPTLFSALLLVLAATLLTLLAAISYRQGSPSTARRWGGLGLLFVFLAFDEAAGFHEMVRDAMKARANYSGVWHFAWPIPYGIAFMAVAGAYFRFLRTLPRNVCRLFVLAAALYIGSALGLEMLAGWLLDGSMLAAAQRGLAVRISYSFEEGGEMLGIAVFVYALLRHLAEQTGEVRVRLTA